MEDRVVSEVWKKGRVVEGFKPDVFRKDCCGAWIRFDEYGNRDGDYGWEIDHAFPRERGGDDNLINLRPMHWKNNVEKGADYPNYFAGTKAEGTVNIDQLFSCSVNKQLRKKLEELYGEEA